MTRYRQYDDDFLSPYEAKPVDAEEEAYKRAGLAASNEAMKKAPKQGFFESFKRLGEGNLDQPGSDAYYKYGAGQGRSIEAAKDQAKAANPMADDSRRMTSRQTAAPAAKALVASKMPPYEGRSANRLADIKNEYEREPEIGDMNAGMGRRDAGKQAARVVSAEQAASPTTARVDRNAYERDKGPVPNAMFVPDTEVYKRSEMDDFGREGRRGPVPNAIGVRDIDVYKRSEMDDFGREDRRIPAPSGQAASGTPIVTKEELAASGMSLRDYLNKQQGLTRREDTKNTKSTTTNIKTPPPGSSSEPSRVLRPNNEGQPGGSLPSKRKGSGTVMEQGRGVDLYGGTLNSLSDLLRGKNAVKRGGGSYAKGGSVKNMASGGSVSSASSRADGIAQRGKTKCKMR
jgi:hypothetical protein